MKIPKDVQIVINHPEYFDYLFLSNLQGRSSEDAFDYTVDYIRKYAPHYTRYKDYSSYVVQKCKQRSKEVDIPKHIIYAVTVSIEDMMVIKLKDLKLRRLAYAEVVKEIQKYFPNYKPYSSYYSYKSSMSHYHKVKRGKR